MDAEKIRIWQKRRAKASLAKIAKGAEKKQRQNPKVFYYIYSAKAE